MEKIPYFSIISIHLNHPDGLARTAQSLKCQSFQDYEWILIDGASTPPVPSALQAEARVYISAPDQGIYDAMNKGLKQAKGDYVLFLNAGDALAGPDVLTQLAALICAQPRPPVFVYGDSLEETKNGPPSYKPARAHHTINLGMFTHHQAMLYRRESLRGLHYDLRYRIAADYDFTLRFLCTAAAQESGAVLYASFALCLFESGGVSQTKAKLGRREQFIIRRRQRSAHIMENIFIYAVQSLVWALRRASPSLYWRLKSKTLSSGNTSSASGQNETRAHHP